MEIVSLQPSIPFSLHWTGRVNLIRIYFWTIRIYHSIGENAKKFLVSEGRRVGELLAHCWVEYSWCRIFAIIRWISAIVAVFASGLAIQEKEIIRIQVKEFPLVGGVDGGFIKRNASSPFSSRRLIASDQTFSLSSCLQYFQNSLVAQKPSESV